MKGKSNYVQAVYELGQYISKISPEVSLMETKLEEQYILTGLVDKALEDKMFEKKAEALQRIIDELESGVKYLPAREVQ
jgi:hypothetical protein